MIRSKRPFKAGDEAAPLWMISFSDLQAQLVLFFALILSASTIDDVKFAQIGAAFTGSKGREAPPPSDNFIVWWVMSKKIDSPKGDKITEERWGPEGREFKVSRVPDGIKISFEKALTFEEGSAEIRQDQMDAISGFLRFIRGSMNKLDVRGFTGPNEEPADGDHWKLSMLRAKAVADLIIAGKGESGINPARVCITGMGKNDPVVDILDTRDPFQWQRNRRVEIIVLEEMVKLR